MLKHYLKIALRNIARQKGLSFINIAGLSIGLACFSLFLLYAVNEFSFDRFHNNADNIFRVYRWTEPMNGADAAGDIYMPSPLGPALKQDIPDVTNYVRWRDPWGKSFIKYNDVVKRAELAYADPSFFTIFNFDLKYGTGKVALANLNDIVITSKKAKELFGSDNVVGQTIEIKVDDEFVPFTISAVARDIPANSSLTFDMLGNFNFMETTKPGKRGINNWKRSSYLTFVQLQKGSSLPHDKSRLLPFRKKYYPDELEKLKDKGYKWSGTTTPIYYGLQSIKETHTDPRFYGGTVPPIDPETIWILLSISAGVLLIACINFTTLAIGRSARRAKEVGIRKVIGGEKKQLIFQFLAEAIILTLLSAVLGLLLARLLLPYFNDLSGRQLNFSFASYPELIWMLAALVILVGVLAGSYPALILSQFKPIDILKKKIKVSGANFFTKSLVTFQFALSIALIICTTIILRQTKFMSGKNPGFNKENIVVVDADDTDTKKIFPLFKHAIQSSPAIDGVAGAELGLGGNEGWSQSGFEYKGKHKEAYEYFIDADYIPVLGMKMIRGRNFDKSISADTMTSIIVNEAMVKDFGWTLDNAVGQELNGFMESKTPVVIGVVKDFNFRSFKEDVQPQMFHQFNDYAPYKFFVKLKAGNPEKAIAAMQKAWGGIVADLPFKYSFLDENLDEFYRAEKKWSNIISWAGGVSIFLACLGLFGLASLAAVNRKKEIGIRKVLGASMHQIVMLLSNNFLRLVIIALAIATPVAWYFMHRWLQDFAYRINISAWIFIISGFAALVIAFLTISVQSIKAASVNPVKSLRSE